VSSSGALSTQRHGAVGAGPEEGHKNDRRDGNTPPVRKGRDS